jgi:hypothetical protein
VFAFYNRHLQPAGGGRGTPPRWIGPSPKVALSGNVPLRPS